MMGPNYQGLRAFLEKRGSKTVADRLRAMDKIASLKRPTSTAQDLLRRLRKPTPVPASVQEAQRRHSREVFARVKADIAKRKVARKSRSRTDLASAQNRADVLFGRGQASTTLPFDFGDMQKASSVLPEFLSRLVRPGFMLEMLKLSAGKIKCPKCGHMNHAGAEKCSNCGYPLGRSKEAAACPLATRDLKVNTKNRNKSIQADHIQYGPLNLSDQGYWRRLAAHWKTTPTVAKKSKCSNCVAFDISPRMQDCMPGMVQEDGYLGYCHMHHFKCHSARTCYTWASGGPITKDSVSLDWEKK